MSDIVVVVPMYNEAAVVGDVVRQLRSVFPHVVCVDDGSRDDSAAQAREAGAVVVRHPLNLGQGAALQTGFEYAATLTESSYVVTFDADGQHRIDDALAMVNRARADHLDVVLGSRHLGTSSGQPVSRRLLLALALRFSRSTTKLQLTDTHNGLRVLSRRAFTAMNLRQRGMAYASELEARIRSCDLTWAEHPVTIDYTDYSRGKGQTNLNAVNILFDLFEARVSA